LLLTKLPLWGYSDKKIVSETTNPECESHIKRRTIVPIILKVTCQPHIDTNRQKALCQEIRQAVMSVMDFGVKNEEDVLLMFFPLSENPGGRGVVIEVSGIPMDKVCGVVKNGFRRRLKDIILSHSPEARVFFQCHPELICTSA
jgi:hypothetical protein